MPVLRSVIACAAQLAGVVHATPGDTMLIDDFRDVTRWQAGGSDQVEARLRQEPTGMCLAFDFHGVSGYAVARRALPIALPPDYEFRLRWRGKGPKNHFQFKLTDASGDNVWWLNKPDTAFPLRASEMRIRQRQITFAWGPVTDKRLREPQALELVVAAGSGGGRGEVCFERLELVERAPPPASWPAPTQVVRGSIVEIDLHTLREFSGAKLRWPASGARPRAYMLEGEAESGQWQALAPVRSGAGPLDALYLPDSEARRLRLRVQDEPAGSASSATALAALAKLNIELVEPGAWRSPDDATAARAEALPRGVYPRTYSGQQNYWTLVGVDGGARHAALISEDGAIEPRPGGPSVEPFVLLHGAVGQTPRLVTWADVRISHGLREGYLPLPMVRWSHPDFTLDIEAAASGDAAHATGLARYTLRPTGRKALKATLLLVARPWQVNPPQQFLNQAGGASPIHTLSWFEGMLVVNATLLSLQATPGPARVLASGGADWPLALALTRGTKVAQLQDGDDWSGSGGGAEGAMAFPLVVAAGREARVGLSWPMAGEFAPLDKPAAVDAAFEASAAAWRERLNRVGLQLPAAGQRVHDTLRSSLAQILLSRDGAALRPGTRSYARSWIRDGAMMNSALLRMGETDAANVFIDWYAGHLFSSGKVPCCVDTRGADPVPENDSHGQFIYAVAELWRFTHDTAALQRRWPAVKRAAQYMEQLRQSERSELNRQPERASFFGLMPASISHEGYSEKAMHSYWDDFWALRGYKDAALLAEAVGDETTRAQFASWRDEFATDLAASIRTATARHGIDFMPGAAELGDFDPTSTTVALNPAQAQKLLPPGLLTATFDRYWRESLQRARGERAWKDYTPYELRTVGSFVRLGQPERAHAMLDFFFAAQRPTGWNQWAEVVMRDPREKHFLGDMPHAWVASDGIRSMLDLFVHEAEEGGREALVLAAGLPEAWLDKGVAIRALPTPAGLLSYRVRRAPGGLQLDIEATGLVPPAGGLRIAWHGRTHRFDKLPVSTLLPD